MRNLRNPIIASAFAFFALALMPARSYVVPASQNEIAAPQPEALPVLELVDELNLLD